ncbi:hypothetical protein LWI29_012071 [Acer saccharum]|uniref:Uncharacterized protein n=1 Tax=Acer saccharum TaxID=4024 RepID=A0AA39SI96_ACESA|nr:hypothetical protein LWI29_012071 [Acer saccharum]
MGFASKESGVLKLVYPGGIVEIHKKPITATEVMKRNPRHCVTRPDVFRFPWPWLVVRPESVLKPGRVFFIVPYHTIHRLLQPKESQNQHLCPPQKVASPTRNSRKKIDSSDFSTELAHFHRLFQKVSINESASSIIEAKTKFEDRPTGCFGSKIRQTKPLISSIQRVHKDDEVDGILNSSEQIIKLRSCLKEENSNAKSRGFRVRFALDEDDKEDSLKRSFRVSSFKAVV